jgi:hypothetical protein
MAVDSCQAVTCPREGSWRRRRIRGGVQEEIWMCWKAKIRYQEIEKHRKQQVTADVLWKGRLGGKKRRRKRRSIAILGTGQKETQTLVR